jgi:hypothetical protein
MNDLKDRRGYSHLRILSFEEGSFRSHYVEKLFWKRL